MQNAERKATRRRPSEIPGINAERGMYNAERKATAKARGGRRTTHWRASRQWHPA